jgi:hypothetical protein
MTHAVVLTGSSDHPHPFASRSARAIVIDVSHTWIDKPTQRGGISRSFRCDSLDNESSKERALAVGRRWSLRMQAERDDNDE